MIEIPFLDNQCYEIRYLFLDNEEFGCQLVNHNYLNHKTIARMETLKSNVFFVMLRNWFVISLAWLNFECSNLARSGGSLSRV